MQVSQPLRSNRCRVNFVTWLFHRTLRKNWSMELVHRDHPVSTFWFKNVYLSKVLEMFEPHTNPENPRITSQKFSKVGEEKNFDTKEQGDWNPAFWWLVSRVALDFKPNYVHPIFSTYKRVHYIIYHIWSIGAWCKASFSADCHMCRGRCKVIVWSSQAMGNLT